MTATPAPLIPRDREAIKAFVADKLYDGESARWRWPLAREPAGYCGWVNAKNRMGAYVGWRLYYVFYLSGAGGVKVLRARMTGDDDAETAKINSLCADDGYDISGPPPK